MLLAASKSFVDQFFCNGVDPDNLLFILPLQKCILQQSYFIHKAFSIAVKKKQLCMVLHV